MIKQYSQIIIEILCIAFLVAVIALIVELFGRKKDREKSEKYAEQRYNDGKQEVSEIMRLTIDKVQEDKQKLLQMDEKELLVEIMLAWGVNARRLDSIEDKISSISNYRQYIELMNQNAQSLSANVVALQENIETTGAQVNTLKSSISEIMNGVNLANQKLEQIDAISHRAENLLSSLNSMIKLLENMSTQANSVADKMNVFFDNYSDSPIATLASIRDEIKKMSELSLSIKSQVGEVQSVTGKIENTLTNMDEELDEQLNELHYGGIQCRLSDISSDLSGMKYDTEEIKEELDLMKSDVTEMKSTVDSTLSDFGMNSITDKIDAIKNHLNC